ncbi:MAG TPA: adventurous gliding motility lipoprotein CglB [Myxococcaceae bacterium]|nr:adventurous gliding motility lipoprotein CglB [Myxococcaceae bacterium]
MPPSSLPSAFSARGSLLAAALLLVVGCQTYDFEPVSPVSLGQTTTSVSISAKQLKPNLMLLLDRSGSMRLPFDPTPAACGSCGQTGQPACDPVACPSRWDALTSTATTFLSQHGTVARMGVAFYPSLSGASIVDPGSGQSSNFCGPASSIDVPLPSSDDDAALRDSAAAVDFAIKRVGATASPLAGGVGGGTPTGDSLVYVADHANFGSTIQRQSFLLLMTDGLPNCNPASGLNANQNPAACDCTDGPTSAVCTYYPVLDCNDFNETARKVSNIRASGVKTIVIGYGDVFGSSAQRTLQQIALAGDFQRRCAAGGGECDPADPSCFLNTNPTLCGEQFFRATSREQLSAALAAVTSAILQGDPCLVQLDPAPVDPTFLTVLVTENGVTTTHPYPSDVWTFAALPDGNATLTFNDPLCSRMRSASENITYEIRSVHRL